MPARALQITALGRFQADLDEWCRIGARLGPVNLRLMLAQVVVAEAALAPEELASSGAAGGGGELVYLFGRHP